MCIQRILLPFYLAAHRRIRQIPIVICNIDYDPVVQVRRALCPSIEMATYTAEMISRVSIASSSSTATAYVVFSVPGCTINTGTKGQGMRWATTTATNIQIWPCLYGIKHSGLTSVRCACAVVVAHFFSSLSILFLRYPLEPLTRNTCCSHNRKLNHFCLHQALQRSNNRMGNSMDKCAAGTRQSESSTTMSMQNQQPE